MEAVEDVEGLMGWLITIPLPLLFPLTFTGWEWV